MGKRRGKSSAAPHDATTCGGPAFSCPLCLSGIPGEFHPPSADAVDGGGEAAREFRKKTIRAVWQDGLMRYLRPRCMRYRFPLRVFGGVLDVDPGLFDAPVFGVTSAKEADGDDVGPAITPTYDVAFLHALQAGLNAIFASVMRSHTLYPPAGKKSEVDVSASPLPSVYGLYLASGTAHHGRRRTADTTDRLAHMQDVRLGKGFPDTPHMEAVVEASLIGGSVPCPRRRGKHAYHVPRPLPLFESWILEKGATAQGVAPCGRCGNWPAMQPQPSPFSALSCSSKQACPGACSATVRLSLNPAFAAFVEKVLETQAALGPRSLVETIQRGYVHCLKAPVSAHEAFLRHVWPVVATMLGVARCRPFCACRLLAIATDPNEAARALSPLHPMAAAAYTLLASPLGGALRVDAFSPLMVDKVFCAAQAGLPEKGLHEGHHLAVIMESLHPDLMPCAAAALVAAFGRKAMQLDTCVDHHVLTGKAAHDNPFRTVFLRARVAAAYLVSRAVLDRVQRKEAVDSEVLAQARHDAAVSLAAYHEVFGPPSVFFPLSPVTFAEIAARQGRAVAAKKKKKKNSASLPTWESSLHKTRFGFRPPHSDPQAHYVLLHDMLAEDRDFGVSPATTEVKARFMSRLALAADDFYGLLQAELRGLTEALVEEGKRLARFVFRDLGESGFRLIASLTSLGSLPPSLEAFLQGDFSALCEACLGDPERDFPEGAEIMEVAEGFTASLTPDASPPLRSCLRALACHARTFARESLRLRWIHHLTRTAKWNVAELCMALDVLSGSEALAKVFVPKVWGGDDGIGACLTLLSTGLVHRADESEAHLNVLCALFGPEETAPGRAGHLSVTGAFLLGTELSIMICLLSLRRRLERAWAAENLPAQSCDGGEVEEEDICFFCAISKVHDLRESFEVFVKGRDLRLIFDGSGAKCVVEGGSVLRAAMGEEDPFRSVLADLRARREEKCTCK